MNARAEHSLTKKYRKLIWNRFIQAIREYGLTPHHRLTFNHEIDQLEFPF